MTKKRKPRAPKVSEEGLAEIKEALDDRELWALTNRFEILEELRKTGVLNTPYIALEALGALAFGLKSGRNEQQLKTTWPKEWCPETATVPLVLLLALADSWDDYRSAPSGKTLGEAFKIEGGGSGNHPMKSILATIDRARGLHRQVETEYLASNHEGEALRIAEAIDKVATKNGISFQTVKDAHDLHRKQIRKDLAELGILNEVKTSQS